MEERVPICEMLDTIQVLQEGKDSLECRHVGTDDVEVADASPLSYPRRDIPYYRVMLVDDASHPLFTERRHAQRHVCSHHCGHGGYTFGAHRK